MALNFPGSDEGDNAETTSGKSLTPKEVLVGLCILIITLISLIRRYSCDLEFYAHLHASPTRYKIGNLGDVIKERYEINGTDFNVKKLVKEAVASWSYDYKEMLRRWNFGCNYYNNGTKHTIACLFV
ncbi:hypothetical protein RB195_014056 [Necator americanus]|uniref:SCP domain-containing protein n=1 Tax=Necator americanus TaxID=51031 RepID=A0ABR1DYJ7_NECAM